MQEPASISTFALLKGATLLVSLCILYAYILWRLFKDNPENRLIRSGITTIAFLFVIGALVKANVPVDYWWWLGPALLLLCFLTLFFLFQRMYRALHKRFTDRSDAT